MILVSRLAAAGRGVFLSALRRTDPGVATTARAHRARNTMLRSKCGMRSDLFCFWKITEPVYISHPIPRQADGAAGLISARNAGQITFQNSVHSGLYRRASTCHQSS